MLYPLSMFCCGCPVNVGVSLILFFHLAACVFYVGSACSNLIFHNPFFSSSWSYNSQLLYTAFCLIGIPTIAAAAWGVASRIEINLRIYLSYLAISFLVDLGAMVYLCLIEDPCETVRSIVTSMTNGPAQWAGEAFLCGAFRIASYVLMTGAVLVEVYCLWVVWSFCEDVHGGKNGPELSGLIPVKDSIVEKTKRPQEGPYAGIVGFAHSKVPGPYPSPYGSISTAGMPGQPTIFGGTVHETSYPPEQGSQLL